jgi:hypothetical protein
VIPVVQVFDLSGEQHEMTAREWNPRKHRERRRFRGVVLHSWDTPVGTTARNRALHGEEEALARRALGTPYTISAGVARHPGAPVVVLAHPLARYTNASDAGNSEWLAIGVMGRFPYENDDVPMDSARAYTEESAALVLAVGAALDLAVRLLQGNDRDAGPFALITHRQTINGVGDHRACPGEAVVRMALHAEAVRRGVLVPDPDLVLVEEHGRLWPASWRRHLPTFSAPPVAAPAPKVATLHLPPPPVLTDSRDGIA